MTNHTPIHRLPHTHACTHARTHTRAKGPVKRPSRTLVSPRQRAAAAIYIQMTSGNHVRFCSCPGFGPTDPGLRRYGRRTRSLLMATANELAIGCSERTGVVHIGWTGLLVANLTCTFFLVSVYYKTKCSTDTHAANNTLVPHIKVCVCAGH